MSSFFIASFVMSLKVYLSGETPEWDTQQLPPKAWLVYTILFGFGMLLWLAYGAVTIVSGQMIKRLKYRRLSLIVAGLNCAWFPLGTILGAFTFAVLCRDSVKSLYSNGLCSGNDRSAQTIN